METGSIVNTIGGLTSLETKIIKMADVPDVNNTCSKLKEMTLKGNLNDSTKHQDTRVSVDLDLSSGQNPDTELQESGDCSEFTFDNVIGHLEDMLIDENFHKLQNGFLEKYWEEFDDSEENKHSYMNIFNEYTNKIEDFITEYLKGKINNFEMEVFVAELEKRKNTLEGEIFEVLLTLSDFAAFKEIFLDYRAMKEGRTVDLGNSLSCRQYLIN